MLELACGHSQKYWYAMKIKKSNQTRFLLSSAKKTRAVHLNRLSICTRLAEMLKIVDSNGKSYKYHRVVYSVCELRTPGSVFDLRG